MKEKLMELLKNEDFSKKICSLTNEKEVLELLKENGISLDSLEDIKKMFTPDTGELSEAELNQVTGGIFSICFGIGFSNTVGTGACSNKGVGADITDDNDHEGLGFSACAYFGYGLGGLYK